MHVLVVEDHADTARSLARLLREWGHDVTIAGSVAEAHVRCVEVGAFDLVLLDLVLEDGSGWDLFRDLQEHCPTPAIALTGLGQASDVQRSLDAGFAAHLTKPVDLDQLRQTIERVLHPQPPPP